MTTTHDLIGQTIKGYELRDRIGQGGFGVVYRAFQPLVARDVAVRVIHPHFANPSPHNARYWPRPGRAARAGAHARDARADA